MPIQIKASTTMVMHTPIIPTVMPMIMVSPSLLSKPSDMMSMPQPGGKLVMGMGSAIDIAKTNENVPIIFSQVFTLMLVIRGLR